MRLKTFSAPTMSEAMGNVRAHMGDDAIIVSTHADAEGGGCRITAAMEEPRYDGTAVETELDPDFDQGTLTAFLRQILTAHGLPTNMMTAMLDTLDADHASPDPALALAAAIDARIRFQPVDFDQPTRPLVLTGVPGAGKTITAAKIAAQAKFAGQSLCVLTTDSKRAGGVEQLQAFTRILGIDLISVTTPDELAAHATAIADADICIVDTAGVNPFDDDDMQTVEAMANTIGGELLLVLPAGGDAMESADTAAAFSAIGATRFIVTRLDMTRRLGGIMAAALGGRIAIANVSINPQVADGLGRLNPVSLSRLIIPDLGPDDFQLNKKVVQ